VRGLRPAAAMGPITVPAPCGSASGKLDQRVPRSGAVPFPGCGWSGISQTTENNQAPELRRCPAWLLERGLAGGPVPGHPSGYRDCFLLAACPSLGPISSAPRPDLSEALAVRCHSACAMDRTPQSRQLKSAGGGPPQACGRGLVRCICWAFSSALAGGELSNTSIGRGVKGEEWTPFRVRVENVALWLR